MTPIGMAVKIRKNVVVRFSGRSVLSIESRAAY
jgi:hypothetical protein